MLGPDRGIGFLHVQGISRMFSFLSVGIELAFANLGLATALSAFVFGISVFVEGRELIGRQF